MSEEKSRETKAKRIKVYNLDGKATRKRVKLPSVFYTPLRRDVIKRAFLALQSLRFQPQGRDPMAGKRTTAESWGVGHGMARVPRIRRTGRAALVTSAVGGRRAHPPVAEKVIVKKIPKKEMRLALKSAIAATAMREVVEARGHRVEEVPELPLVVVDELQGLRKTSEVVDALMALGVWPDVLRAKNSKKVRAGKGKMRGRRYKRAVGPLIVVGEDKGIMKAARNLPGVDVVLARNLNVGLLAPGTHPGRLTIWTPSALKVVEELWGD